MRPPKLKGGIGTRVRKYQNVAVFTSARGSHYFNIPVYWDKGVFEKRHGSLVGLFREVLEYVAR